MQRDCRGLVAAHAREQVRPPFELPSLRKTTEQITALPKRPVPTMQLLSEIEQAYCSFEDFFMDRVAAKSKIPATARGDFRSGAGDNAIHQLMRLLIGEW